ncbi:hypothetical protein [Roseibium sediminicola]|uniref:Uncharacterized protein n=1 Tax=Roseibium sediminicola TaxID=2933272 RepID=A0ABT0GXR9_9HYPH|nr:hypothetical protein [Roseibium sp. CAU 1639]MCK7613603.1 hypothetical protein [Roseibium sp. CAU 1639]
MDAQGAWKKLKEGRFVLDRKLFQDWWDEKLPKNLIVGETIASQLPGRQNGGAADAYRHILLSAECTRRYGPDTAFSILTDHELDAVNGADNGLDMWNNSIGMRIGQYVRENDGGWEDVVRLSRAAIHSSFATNSFAEVAGWKKRRAEEGIRKAYQDYLETYKTSRKSWVVDPMPYSDFAEQFNQAYAFRARDGVVVLEGGKLTLEPAAMTSSKHWRKHPNVMVDGKEVELNVSQSQFPTDAWFEGSGFVYETGNAAPSLRFSPDERRRTLRQDFREFPLGNAPSLPGAAQIPWPEFDKTLPSGGIGLPSEQDPDASLLFQSGDRAAFGDQERDRRAQAGQNGDFDVVGPTGVADQSQLGENAGKTKATARTSFDRFRALGSDAKIEAKALAEYQTLLRQAYVEMVGDDDAAANLAIERFSRTWGLSEFSSVSPGTVLNYPAEKVYPDVNGDSHAYLRTEAERYLQSSGLSTGRWYLSPNDKTGSDWRQGGRDADGFGPRLTLSYESETGAQLEVTDRFQARLPGAQAEAAA